MAIYIALTLLLTVIALFFRANGFAERHPHTTRSLFVDGDKAGGDLTTQERFKSWRQFGGRVLQSPEDVLTILNFRPDQKWFAYRHAADAPPGNSCVNTCRRAGGSHVV